MERCGGARDGARRRTSVLTDTTSIDAIAALVDEGLYDVALERLDEIEIDDEGLKERAEDLRLVVMKALRAASRNTGPEPTVVPLPIRLRALSDRRLHGLGDLLL